MAQEPRNETRLSVSLGNEAAYASGMRVPGPSVSNLALLRTSFAWRHGETWRFAASVNALADTHGETHARIRPKEVYGGLTLGDFDFVLGRKILKWGTGYAFTPTGILDPVRNPTDPTDRLDLNEGRELGSVQWIKGRHALTAAWASGGVLQRHRPGLREVTAFRYNALVAGFDSSLIYARERGRPAFTGANFTRVIGEAVEIHGEVAHRDGTSVLAGGKYSFRCGLGVIAEFYSPQSGSDRGRYGFIHVGKNRLRELPGWKEWDLGFSIVSNLKDRSRIAVFDATRRLGQHYSVYGRVQAPAGPKWRSEYGMIPYAALVSAGFRVQI